jgi:hypothetical protein
MTNSLYSQIRLSLSLSKDWLEEEIESWENFRSGLRNEDYVLFKQMLEEAKEYKDVIKSKENMSTETLLMALILKQQKIINSLLEKYQKKS